jgi:hypothetical protein
VEIQKVQRWENPTHSGTTISGELFANDLQSFTLFLTGHFLD